MVPIRFETETGVDRKMTVSKRRSFLFRVGWGALAFLFLVGCVPSTGDVVRVTTVEESRDSALREEEKARLEAIQRNAATPAIDEKLNRVLEQTSQLTVSEFLARYPEAAKGGEDYVVGGYDVLSLLVYEEEDLSREAVRVSGDGFISFPLVGRLQIGGLTTSQIERMISSRLAEGQYLLDAHVSVMVKEFESKRYLVLGAVETPGSYSLRAQERLLDAISRAGGLERVPTARGGRGEGMQRSKRAMIIRTVSPGTDQESKIVIKVSLDALMREGDPYANLFLADKDTVYISPPEYFYIIGEVNGPGAFTIPEDEITLIEAIGMAGGFTKIAARNRTRIIRVEGGKEKILEVQVDAITKAGKKIHDVVIKPGDVIVVPESFF